MIAFLASVLMIPALLIHGPTSTATPHGETMTRPTHPLQLIVVRGLPGSGKTTWARSWVAQWPAGRARVNRDDLRAMMFGEQTDYSHEQETAVTAAERQSVKALLAAGRSVVVDATHLRTRYVREWARFARSHGAELEVKDFPISVDEAIARDAARDRTVGEDVIRGMTRFLRDGQLPPIPDALFDFAPEEVDTYVPDPMLPPAVLVDIDGTVALNTGGRSHYDLTRVSEDTPNEAVIAAVRHAYDFGVDVIYLSGREDTCREDTAAWLKTHVRIPGPLYMRPADDKRKDSIVKRELFDAHVRDRYSVLYVLDDRDQVVRMWRALGLTVLQVAEGDF